MAAVSTYPPPSSPHNTHPNTHTTLPSLPNGPKPRTVSAPSPPTAHTAHNTTSPRHPSASHAQPPSTGNGLSSGGGGRGSSGRKPILNWLHRKLQSARRASSSLPSPSLAPSARAGNGSGSGSGKYHPLGPGPTQSGKTGSSNGSNGTPLQTYPSRRSRPTADAPSLSGRISPTSDHYPPTNPSEAGTEPEAEADDDASTRPLPPTSPPSPAPSRHTYSSRLSVRSGSTNGTGTSAYGGSGRGSSFAVSASTKPTTLLSIDSAAGFGQTMGQGQGGLGRGHPAPSIHFSHLPPSSPTPSGPGSVPHTPTQSSAPFGGSALDPSTAGGAAGLGISPTSGAVENKLLTTLHNPRAPRFSQPHPSRNPDPQSPAQDNASILTLASTTAGGRLRPGSFYPSSLSRREAEAEEGWYGYGYGYDADGYGYGYGYGEDGDGEGEGEGSASVRAIKPRSRRGSWGTERTGGTFGTMGTVGTVGTGGVLEEAAFGAAGVAGAGTGTGTGEGEGEVGEEAAEGEPIGHALDRRADAHAASQQTSTAERDAAADTASSHVDEISTSASPGASTQTGSEHTTTTTTTTTRRLAPDGLTEGASVASLLSFPLTEGSDSHRDKERESLVPDPDAESAEQGEHPERGEQGKHGSEEAKEAGLGEGLGVHAGGEGMELDTPVPRGRVLEGED